MTPTRPRTYCGHLVCVGGEAIDAWTRSPAANFAGTSSSTLALPPLRIKRSTESALSRGSPTGPKSGGQVESEGFGLPIGMEDRFVGLLDNRAEPVSAAHVVRTVHGATTTSVPIIELRLTMSASCSSLQPSVPAGRIGRTR